MRKELKLQIVQWGKHVLVKTIQIDERDRGSIKVCIPENYAIKKLESVSYTAFDNDTLFVSGDKRAEDERITHDTFDSESVAKQVVEDIKRLVDKHNHNIKSEIAEENSINIMEI